jgi:hypothetical protein
VITVGRTIELKKIRSNLKRKVSTLLVGAKGVGKTHLLKHLKEEGIPPRASPRVRGELRGGRGVEGGASSYYLPNLSPAKDALLNLLIHLTGWSEQEIKEHGVKRWTLNKITAAIIKTIENKEFVLIIDNLDHVSAAHSQLLINLISHVPILGAASEIKASKALMGFFWAFEVIDLKPLTDAHIESLLSSKIKGINFKDGATKRLFVKKVVQAAKGIPLAASEMVNKTANVKTVTRTFIRRELKEHQSAVKYLDATYLWFFLIAVAAAMRYISRGMHSTDAYVFFGALYAVLLIVRLMIYRIGK